MSRTGRGCMRRQQQQQLVGRKDPGSLATAAARVPSSGQQSTGMQVPLPSCVVWGLCSCNMLLLCRTRLDSGDLLQTNKTLPHQQRAEGEAGCAKAIRVLAKSCDCGARVSESRCGLELRLVR